MNDTQPPFIRIGTPQRGGIIAVADHAGDAVPAEIELGIPAELMEQHIAVDIGTAGLAERLEIKGRRIVVLSVPGDRRDLDVVEAAQVLAGKFDHYICKADDDRRHRGEDEIPQMFKAEFLKLGIAEHQISVIPNEEAAVAASLEMAQPEDLLVIFGDNSARCWKQIIYFNAAEDQENGTAHAEGAPSGAMFEEFMDHDLPIVRDGRGVRLARERVEDGD